MVTTGTSGDGPRSGQAYHEALLARLQRESTAKKVKLLRYWLSLKDNGIPDYRRFDALDIPGLLGDLAVVEVERPERRFRIRLYGTKLTNFRGKDLTGLYVGALDVFPPDLSQIYLRSYQEVEASGEPLFQIVPYELQRRAAGHYHRLLLPFTDSARPDAAPRIRRCDMIILSFESVPSAWAGKALR